MKLIFRTRGIEVHASEFVCVAYARMRDDSTVATTRHAQTDDCHEFVSTTIETPGIGGDPPTEVKLHLDPADARRIAESMLGALDGEGE